MEGQTLIPEEPPVPPIDEEIKADVVVIGGGPNGLINAAYLARSGLKVVILERRQELGGGLATEEILFPGIYANTHATYHMMVDYMPVLDDFDLRRHALMFIKPNAQTGIVLEDGSSMLLCTKIQDCIDQIDKFSSKDAKAFNTMIRDFRTVVDEILAPATYYPPMPPIEFVVALNKTLTGRKLNDITEKSPLEIIDETFTNDKVKALFLYLSCMWGLAPDITGMGFMVPLLVYRNLNKYLCVGGSHKLSSSLAKELVLNGGLILENAEATKIIMENGKAVGVETHDGIRVMAKVVVSSLDPHSTFLKLVGEDKLTPELAKYVNGWEWDKWSLFTLHLAINEQPKYIAKDRNINDAFMNIIGIESMDDVLKLTKRAMEGGTLPVPAGHCTTETRYDTTLSRQNKVHSAFFQMLASYDAPNGWEESKKEAEKAALETWKKYTQNITDETIVMMGSESPLDIERRIPCMVRGSIKHGDYSSLQMGYFRPNDLCSNSKTPFEGLYLCGASMNPGGLIIGGPGYIAANIIAEDMGVKKWWKTPESIKTFIQEYIE